MKERVARRIGLTTTVPMEVLIAAGKTPIDLNNIFITSPIRDTLVATAERADLPRNTCGWINGIYSITLEEGIEEIVAVTQGDCSNTHALTEVLQAEHDCDWRALWRCSGTATRAGSIDDRDRWLLW